MRKTIISLLLIFVVASSLQAQDASEKYGKIGKNLKIGLEFISDYWASTPDKLDPSWFNRGFNMNAMWKRDIGKSPMGVAIGLGLSSNNLYCKKAILRINEDGVSEFVQPATGVSVSKTKINLTYVDVPFELSFKFKFGLHLNAGFKAGYLINSMFKFEGNGQAIGLGDESLKVKFKELRNIEELRYGPTFRIGYKWINLTAFYQLSSIFMKGLGPDMAPITFGIAVIPF